jgi:hypothetical protein
MLLKYFFGGNFVQSNNPAFERELMNYVLSISPTYNRFLSYAFKEDAKRIIEAVSGNPRVNLIIDSGAFSGLEDVEGYMKFLEEHKDSLDYYVNVDVLNDGEQSWRNYVRMRKEGFSPIPVWHAITSVKYLLRYRNETSYIGIGGIAGKGMNSKKTIERLDPIVKKYLVDKDGDPIANYHAFGLTLEVLKRYPFRSADSTNWVQYSGKLATILVPKWKDGKWDYREEPHKIKVGTRHTELDKHLLKLDPETQDEIKRYLEENGFKYGLFTCKEDCMIDNIEGLCNSQHMRDRINALFFIRFSQSLPPWPWPFKLKT